MLKVGDKFESYENFKSKLSEYEEATSTKYWIRDCRTVKTQLRRHTKTAASIAPEYIKYYYVRLACINGSKKQKSVLDDSLNYFDCPAYIYIKLTPCGQYLEVAENYEEHNCLSECETKEQSVDDEFSNYNTCFNEVKVNPHKRWLKRKIVYESDPSDDENMYNDFDEKETRSNKAKLRQSFGKMRLSKYEKLVLMNEQCWTLAKLCSNGPTIQFNKRLRIINRLIDKWSNENGDIKYVNNIIKDSMNIREHKNNVLVNNVMDDIVSGECLIQDDTDIHEEFFLKYNDKNNGHFASHSTNEEHNYNLESVKKKKTIKLAPRSFNNIKNFKL